MGTDPKILPEIDVVSKGSPGNDDRTYYPVHMPDADGDNALFRSLNDKITPGVIDASEYHHNPELKLEKWNPLRWDPPLLWHIRNLADKGTSHCFANIFGIDCQDWEAEVGLTELEPLARNDYLLGNLPLKAVNEWLQLSKKMESEGINVEVRHAGEQMARGISHYLATEKNHFQNMPRNRTSYAIPSVQLREVRGLENSIEYWREFYKLDRMDFVLARENSKSDIHNLSLFRRYFNDITREGKSIATARANAEETLKAYQKKLNGAGGEKFLYKEGQKNKTEFAASRFAEWQPYLEGAFVEQGLPPWFATLAIIESGFDISVQDSPNGAMGVYQFMKPVAEKLGLVIDEENGVNETHNPILAAQAAAKLLAEAVKRIERKDFLSGVTVDHELALLMATSAYNAGVGNLQKGMKKAQAVTHSHDAEEIFAYLLKSDLKVGAFGKNSKDYPPQLYPAVEAVYPSAPEKVPPIRLVSKRVVVTLKTIDFPIPLSKILKQIDFGFDFMNANPQYNWTGWEDLPESLPSIAGEGRFILDAADVEKMKYWLKKNGYVVHPETSVEVTEIFVPS